jgi:hypothetical protein
MAFIPLVIGAALGLAGCVGGQDKDVSGTSPAAGNTAAAESSATPAEGRPSASATAGMGARPSATAEPSEAQRALAAAEVILGGAADPACTPTAEVPTCIVPQLSQATVERGIAAFGVSDYPFGGAVVFLGKTPEGEWRFWFGTQNITYQLTVLPGGMRVCAGGAGLNVRASPSADSESLGLLADNAIVTVDRFVLTEPRSMGPTGQGAGYGWYHLTDPKEGWAYSKFLSAASLGDCTVHDALVGD